MEVIVLPDAATLDSAISCIQAGACDFLPGPYSDPDRVTSAVARAVNKGRLARDRKLEIENLAQKNEVLLATNHFLAEQVKRDGLTGLYNHAYFQEVLAREASRAGRYKRAFTLLFADIDHFKQYNDREGHQAGDKALVMVAEILRRCTRKSDYVARYGGEEFVILLPETAKDRGRIVAGRICRHDREPPVPRRGRAAGRRADGQHGDLRVPGRRRAADGPDPEGGRGPFHGQERGRKRLSDGRISLRFFASFPGIHVINN